MASVEPPKAVKVTGASVADLNGCYGLAGTTNGVAEYWKVIERQTRKKKVPDLIYRIRGGDAYPECKLDDSWLLFNYDDEGKSTVFYAAKRDVRSLQAPPSEGWMAASSDASTVKVESFDTSEPASRFVTVSANVTKAKQAVGSLKDMGKKKGDPVLDAAISELQALMSDETQLRGEALCAEIAGKKYREAVRAELKQVSDACFIYTLSADIHGGCAGLYDYGPTGAALKSNLLAEWRRHFIIEEDMLEIESSMLTPESVLVTSGHVAKFADLMVKDEVTGACHRADKLLESHIEELLDTSPEMTAEERTQHRTVAAKADGYTPEELGAILKEYKVTAPETGNPITQPFPFNLMFATEIGPTGKQRGFLRPETAQGIFVNFHKLLAFNNGDMPFAAAQIGHSFRNEIAPRGGLLRVREFQMAEIEHFCTDDVTARFPKFDDVADMRMRLLRRDSQEAGVDEPDEISIEKAVELGYVSQTTLGYYMARTQLFLTKIGIDPQRLRFRQHLANEMAHYARDCWDAEIETSYGWIECVGHADRACFDLSQHSAATGVKLEATRMFASPRTEEYVHKVINKKAIGRTYKKKSADLLAYLDALDDGDAIALDAQLSSVADDSVSIAIKLCSGEFALTREMFSINQMTRQVHSKTYVPPVVEPSFGIGRILYSLLEHSLYLRPDDCQRKVLRLRPRMAPTKVMIFPLSSHNAEQNEICRRVHRDLKSRYGVPCRIDASTASPGRRYSRADQLGTPFHVTIDFQSLKDETATIRERDSTKQIRVPIGEIARVLADLADERAAWEEVFARFPEHCEQEI
jgi:glycyl-tRNA synthetase